MGYPDFHIAQGNIALGLAPFTDPVMRGFVEQLDHINAVADAAPGFVWRLQTDEGNATSIRLFADPQMIVNMSVWDSLESLHAYVYESEHLRPLKAKREWFGKMDRPPAALWWVPAGTLPTLEDLEYRLDLMRDHGPGPDAFTFVNPFDPDGRPLDSVAASRRRGAD